MAFHELSLDLWQSSSWISLSASFHVWHYFQQLDVLVKNNENTLQQQTLTHKISLILCASPSPC